MNVGRSLQTRAGLRAGPLGHGHMSKGPKYTSLNRGKDGDLQG